MSGTEAKGKLKQLYIIPAVLGIAACSTPPNTGRTIELSRSVPVSSTAFLKDVNTLVRDRDYSYVSLIISKPRSNKLNSTALPRSIPVTTGSGFVIDTKGHIVTAAHVGIARGWQVLATGPQGNKYRGRVVAIQRIGDMALIKLDTSELLTPVNPVKNPCIPKGSPVFSLGKPGLRQDIARVGTLSKLRYDKPVRYLKYGYNDAMVLNLQTRRGESGGPLFDHSGAFLGMIVSTLSTADGRYLNLAHAIPAPALGKFICARTKCLPAWRTLARKKLSACPATAMASVRTS